MIRSQSEYRESRARLGQGRVQLDAYRAQLEGMGLGADEVEVGMGPVRHFLGQLEEDVARYERLGRGELEEWWAPADLGRLLTEARIAGRLSQRELARKVGVHESQVSRDERNDYSGVTWARAGQILEAAGVEVRLQVAVRSAGQVIFDEVIPSPARRKFAQAPEFGGVRPGQLPSAA